MFRMLNGRKSEQSIQRGPRVYLVPEDTSDDNSFSAARRFMTTCETASDFMSSSKHSSSGWMYVRLEELLSLEAVSLPIVYFFSSHSMGLRVFNGEAFF